VRITFNTTSFERSEKVLWTDWIPYRAEFNRKLKLDVNNILMENGYYFEQGIIRLSHYSLVKQLQHTVSSLKRIRNCKL